MWVLWILSQMVNTGMKEGLWRLLPKICEALEILMIRQLKGMKL
jgi:hypothetical protein